MTLRNLPPSGSVWLLEVLENMFSSKTGWLLTILWKLFSSVTGCFLTILLKYSLSAPVWLRTILWKLSSAESFWLLTILWKFSSSEFLWLLWMGWLSCWLLAILVLWPVTEGTPQEITWMRQCLLGLSFRLSRTFCNIILLIQTKLKPDLILIVYQNEDRVYFSIVHMFHVCVNQYF